MRMASARRGISPVIATVIIVAVAIAISIAVAGWLFGLWGSLGTAQPQIKITGVAAQYDDQNNQLLVTLAYSNTGNAADKILSAVVVLPNGTSVSVDPTAITVTADGTQQTEPVLPANSEGTIEITFGAITNLNAGDRVTVEIVLAETGKHSTVLTVTTG